MNIMNALPSFFLCAIPIVLIMIVTAIFMTKAYRESQRIGMSKAYVKKVIMNSALVSIVPTLPIIISLAVLMPILGKFVPWFRLSVIGSAGYEMMAADLALKSTGIVEGIGASVIPDGSFISIVWAMSIGCITSLVITGVALKKIDLSLAKAKGTVGILAAAGGCAMTAVMATFVVPMFCNFENPMGLLGAASGAVIAVIISLIAKATKIKVLNDFVFPLSMLCAMAVVVIVSL